MTAVELQGFYVTWDEFDNIVDFGAAELLASSGSGTGFSYVVNVPATLEDMPYVTTTFDSWSGVRMVNGVDVPPGSFESLGYIQTAAGQHVLYTIELPDGRDFIFQIGGPALTMPTNANEFIALGAQITGYGQASGIFAPETEINYLAMSNTFPVELASQSLKGFFVDWGTGSVPDFVDSAELFIRFPEADGVSSLSYTVLSTPPGELPEVETSPEAFEGFVHNGEYMSTIPDDATEYLGYIDTAAGRHIVYTIETSWGGQYIFQISGPPLAIPTTPAEAAALDASITGVGQATGAFAPGMPISFASMLNLTSYSGDLFLGTSGDDVLIGGLGDDTLTGGDGNDMLDGGAGNDWINPGDNTGNGLIIGSVGNDTINLGEMFEGYVELDYYNVGMTTGQGINATISGSPASGLKSTVLKGAGGVDTILEAGFPMFAGWFNGGLGVTGTDHADSFTLWMDPHQWAQISAGGGNDLITITNGTGSAQARFSYRGAINSVVADLSTGSVSQDGFGGSDQIVGAFWEFEGGNGNDSIMGSAGDESFILGAGWDTLDGGAGFDQLRFDRSQVDSAVTVDLAAGTATGTWNGFAFSHTMTGIEAVRGSRTHDDTLSGSSADELFLGRGGDDLITGRGGDDTLRGEDGNDTLLGGDGNDLLVGGMGDDLLNPGDNVGGDTGNDRIELGYGNDTIDMSDILTGYVTLDGSYFAHMHGTNMDVTINGATNTGSIVFDGANSATLVNVANPMDAGWTTGGLGITGSVYGDVYTLHADTDQWMQVIASGGSDQFYISGPGTIRLTYREQYSGITADLNAGVVYKPSGLDVITGNIWELEGTSYNDSIMGSTADESFILAGGVDTLDGDGGFDRLRYDRGGNDSGITADLQANSVTGTWYGFGFSHEVYGIEHLRGSNHADSIRGDMNANLLEGRAGDDTLEGGGGNDTLTGGLGADVFMLGAGEGDDSITDFEIGIDSLDLSAMGLTDPELDALFNAAVDTAGGAVVDFLNGTTLTFEGLTALDIEPENLPPSTDMQALSLGQGDTILLGDIFNYSDPNNDPWTKIELWDSYGGNNWLVNGVAVNAATGYEITSLANVQLQGDATVGSQWLYLRAHDGKAWSSWDPFLLTTTPAPNTPPVAAVDNQTSAPLAWTRLSDVLTLSDAENDTITKLEVWDDKGANNWYVSGVGLVDASSGYEFNAGTTAWFQGDAAAGTQRLYVRAFDGKAWGTWDSFILTTAAAKPTATIDDQTIGTSAVRALDDVFVFSDPENDPLVKVEIYDASGASDNWLVNGSAVNARMGLEVADTSTISFIGDASASSQTMWIRAFEGTDWSDWDSFTLTTV